MTSILIPLYFTVPLLVYFCGALIIGIIALVKVIKLWKLKKIEGKNLIIGIIISISLFGFLYLIYKGEKERFSLIFVGPFLMVFLPFILSILTKKLKTENFISKVLLVSVAFTVIGYTFKLLTSLLLKNL